MRDNIDYFELWKITLCTSQGYKHLTKLANDKNLSTFYKSLDLEKNSLLFNDNSLFGLHLIVLKQTQSHIGYVYFDEKDNEINYKYGICDEYKNKNLNNAICSFLKDTITNYIINEKKLCYRIGRFNG